MGERFPVTLYLGVVAMAAGAVFGILVGLLAAIYRGRWIDRMLTPLTYLGICVPVFWLGILMIYLFGLKLNWLPISGYTSPFEDYWMSTRQMIMPVICLAVFALWPPTPGRCAPACWKSFAQDYIRTAWAKGLGAKR